MQQQKASSEAAIFDVHLEILDDPELLDAVLARIRQQQSAALAWQTAIEARAETIASVKDPLLAARAADIHDVGYRVLRLLVGADDHGYHLPDHPVVVVAHDLSPSDTASLPKDRVLGFCTAVGGPTAHSAIIARALSLPAVVSAGSSILALENGTPVILNGDAGTLILAPDEETLARAREGQRQWQARRLTAARAAADPAVTQDGHRVEVPPENNPFLGERGIRLCLARPELLRQQVRAILRAVDYGSLRIMFPMVADIRELRQARNLVEDVRAELLAPPVEVGIMVEVPSAALMADVLAKEVDFFSVGTNDLTQYTLAMDRQHPSLASYSDGLHPAVLRLIARTVEAAHQEGKWVGVCGELGADPQAVPILVGLGVDELSVSVPAIPTVKAQIRALTLSRAQALAEKALACATAAEVRELVGKQ